MGEEVIYVERIDRSYFKTKERRGDIEEGEIVWLTKGRCTHTNNRYVSVLADLVGADRLWCLLGTCAFCRKGPLCTVELKDRYGPLVHKTATGTQVCRASPPDFPLRRLMFSPSRISVEDSLSALSWRTMRWGEHRYKLTKRTLLRELFLEDLKEFLCRKFISYADGRRVEVFLDPVLLEMFWIEARVGKQLPPWVYEKWSIPELEQLLISQRPHWTEYHKLGLDFGAAVM